jgi:aminoglycoside 3-N-acetyltransferase
VVVTRSQLARELGVLGLKAGQTVMVHASVRALGRIVGGPDTVIRALLDVLTDAGTVMIYVSWEEWERALVDDVDTFSEAERLAYLDECPPFDPITSRAERRWGVLTEYLRTWPGAQRSNHPTASVVALGAGAQHLTENHPLAYGYGIGSPFDRICQRRGKVVLLGSPLNAVTLLHYAEHIAPLPNKRVVVCKTPVLLDGVRTWVEFEEFDTSDGIVPGESSEEYFEEIVRAYLMTGRGSEGRVGEAHACLFDAADLVAFAVEWMVQRWGGYAEPGAGLPCGTMSWLARTEGVGGDEQRSELT